MWKALMRVRACASVVVVPTSEQASSGDSVVGAASDRCLRAGGGGGSGRSEMGARPRQGGFSAPASGAAWTDGVGARRRLRGG